MLSLEKAPSILVVDDDESNRESLRRRLERRGYAVAVAVDGKDALSRIEQFAFDLVILDVMMPGLNGMEVLDILRKTYSQTQLPVIMATARDQSEDVVAALDHGANDYVTKPLDFSVVSARVRTHLALKRSVDQILELEAALKTGYETLKVVNHRLEQTTERTARELSAAAKVQQAFLPHANPYVPGARFAWVFQPCSELAGDSLNVVQLDDQNVAFYVLDVSGHGVAASLLAVMVTRLLSPSASGDSLVFHPETDGSRRISEPFEVATRLTKNFSIDATEQFVTLFYAIYNSSIRELKYISAGHPAAICLRPGNSAIILEGTGQPIGVGEKYEQHTIRLNPSDRLYLYSDGVTEAMDPSHSLFGSTRLLHTLEKTLQEPLAQSISTVAEAISRWRAGTAPKDDISILGMECA
jgi:sigma-B regulation protein RsbU (phosphoserine phosphatase)